MSRFLLIALLLAAPCRADDAGEAPGAGAAKSRRLIENLPIEARVELRRMYRRYADVVAARLEQGWRAGLLDERVIAGGEDEVKPARLTEDMLRARRREIRELEAAFEKKTPERDRPDYVRARRLIAAKTQELAELRERAARDKGLCRDWSDLVWHELTAMNLEHWAVRDEVRRARPFHSSAVACSPPEAPVVCLAFDPWRDGRADVHAFNVWDEGAMGGRFPRDYLMHELPEKAP